MKCLNCLFLVAIFSLSSISYVVAQKPDLSSTHYFKKGHEHFFVEEYGSSAYLEFFRILKYPRLIACDSLVKIGNEYVGKIYYIIKTKRGIFLFMRKEKLEKQRFLGREKNEKLLMKKWDSYRNEWVWYSGLKSIESEFIIDNNSSLIMAKLNRNMRMVEKIFELSSEDFLLEYSVYRDSLAVILQKRNKSE